MCQLVRRTRVLLPLLVVALLAAACIVPWSTATYPFSVESDVVYGQGEVDGGGTFDDLLLDLYIPDLPDSAPMALMLMIHGGGFTGGSKTSGNLVASAEEYARRGWLVASIDYRLLGDDPVPSARVQPLYDVVGGANGPALLVAIVAAVDDAITALEFLQARDDVHPPWTTLWGSSAGAITSLLTAYSLDDYGIERPPVAAVIDLWGAFFGIAVGPPFDDPTGTDPVLFTVHGTNDSTVPFSQAEAIESWANDAGLPFDYHPIAGAGHGVNLFTTEASPGVSLYQRSVDWLHETVFDGLVEGPVLD